MKNHIVNLSFLAIHCVMVFKSIRQHLVLLASLFALFASGIAFGQNVPPTVSLTGPAAGATYIAPATIQFTATAADSDGTVSVVQVLNDGTPFYSLSATGGGNYAATWNNVAAGTYHFTVLARDNNDATTITSTPITVVVNPNTPPTVSLTGPAAGATYIAPATIQFTATAADIDGTIAYVQVANNGTPFYTLSALGGGNYGATWNNVAAGTYHFTALARDSADNITTTTPITVVVNASTPPTVSLTGPATGATYAAPALIHFTATAADSDGTIASVVLAKSGTPFLTMGNAGGGSYVVDWGGVAAGTYQLTAIATDNAGLSTTSAPTTITVNPNTPPVVTLNGPVSGSAYVAPAQIPLSATATDSDGTINSVELWANGTHIANFGAAGGANFGGFWQGVAAGTYTVTAVAVDNGGLRTTSAPATIIVNPNMPPVISLNGPVSGSAYVAPAQIPLSATATDSDGTINSVELWANGTHIADFGAAGGANFGGFWQGVAAGTYTVTAVAVDNAGLRTTSSPATIIVNPNKPPTVSVTTTPQSGGSYVAPAGIVFNVTAADSDGTVTGAEIWKNGAPLAGLGSSGGGHFGGILQGVAAGTYTYTVVVTDNGGATTTSTPITVTVNPNIPPVISLFRPLNGSSLVAPATVNIQVGVTDVTGGIDHGTFTINGGAEHLLGGGIGGQFGAAWGPLAVGTYTVVAKAYDNAGATTLSDPATFTVYPSQPPTVSIATPANNAIFPTGTTIPLRVNAGDTDGTVSQVQLFAGATLIGTASLASGTATSGAWVTNWTGATAGTYTVTAVATDNSTAAVTSAPITVTVSASAGLTVGLTAPTGGSTYTAPANVALAASATSNTYGVAQVEFFNGATSLGLGTLTSGTASSGSYVTNAMTNVPAGTYTVTAVATENGGFSVTSSPVTFTVGAASSGANATMYFIEADHLGTPRLIADQMQQAVWKWNQGEAFGDSVPDQQPGSSGAFVFNQRFPGQYFDQETSTSYNNARDYDSNGGRYVQSDPIGLAGGSNTYAYVKGNPLSSVDASGLVAWSGTMTGGGAIVMGGAMGFYYNLDSECKCGYRLHLKGFISTVAVGGGFKYTGSGGPISFVDDLPCPEETAPNGLARGFAFTGTIGLGGTYGQMDLGKLATGEPSGGPSFGFDVSMSAFHGRSAVLSSTIEKCPECEPPAKPDGPPADPWTQADFLYGRNRKDR